MYYVHVRVRAHKLAAKVQQFFDIHKHFDNFFRFLFIFSHILLFFLSLLGLGWTLGRSVHPRRVSSLFWLFTCGAFFLFWLLLGVLRPFPADLIRPPPSIIPALNAGHRSFRSHYCGRFVSFFVSKICIFQNFVVPLHKNLKHYDKKEPFYHMDRCLLSYLAGKIKHFACL